jgi:hypothetical protein
MPEPRAMLRAATAQDANHIARPHTLSWQTAYSHILPAAYLSGEVPTEHAMRWRQYLDRDEKEWGLVLIAEADGEPAGFVSAECPVDPTLGVLLDMPACPSFASRKWHRKAHDRSRSRLGAHDRRGQGPSEGAGGQRTRDRLL